MDLLALEETMGRLREFNRRWYDVVDYRFYADRSLQETADLLGVGLTTVKSDWVLARAWLRKSLAEKR